MAGFAPRHILCLIDLSPASPAVLSWAHLFADRFHSPVEIFHAAWSVTPQAFAEGKSLTSLELELRKTELYGALNTVAREILGSTAPYHVSLVEGHPVQAVFERIGREIPDLIVMGSHGHDGMARLMLGSVAENVVRMAPCPMLVVKGDRLSPTLSSLKQVVCPLNLTESSRDCFDLASLLAESFAAELRIVQVREEGGPHNERIQQLRDWLGHTGSGHPQISETVLFGEPGQQIVAFLRREESNLVVVAAEQRPFFEFTVLGRTTERVMRYSPCSVLLVPRKG